MQSNTVKSFGVVSLQIAIIKVLSGHPAGRASSAALKADLAILATSGRDWTERMKLLAGRAPGLDAFGQRYILRDDSGWQLTDLGRTFLTALEAPRPVMPALEVVTATDEPVSIPVARPLRGSLPHRAARRIRSRRTG